MEKKEIQRALKGARIAFEAAKAALSASEIRLYELEEELNGVTTNGWVSVLDEDRVVTFMVTKDPIEKFGCRWRLSGRNIEVERGEPEGLASFRVFRNEISDLVSVGGPPWRMRVAFFFTKRGAEACPIREADSAVRAGRDFRCLPGLSLLEGVIAPPPPKGLAKMPADPNSKNSRRKAAREVK